MRKRVRDEQIDGQIEKEGGRGEGKERAVVAKYREKSAEARRRKFARESG